MLLQLGNVSGSDYRLLSRRIVNGSGGFGFGFGFGFGGSGGGGNGSVVGGQVEDVVAGLGVRGVAAAGGPELAVLVADAVADPLARIVAAALFDALLAAAVRLAFHPCDHGFVGIAPLVRLPIGRGQSLGVNICTDLRHGVSLSGGSIRAQVGSVCRCCDESESGSFTEHIIKCVLIKRGRTGICPGLAPAIITFCNVSVSLRLGYR